MRYILSFGLAIVFGLNVSAQQSRNKELPLDLGMQFKVPAALPGGCPNLTPSIIIPPDTNNPAIVLKPADEIDPKINICPPVPAPAPVEGAILDPKESEKLLRAPRVKLPTPNKKP